MSVDELYDTVVVVLNNNNNGRLLSVSRAPSQRKQRVISNVLRQKKCFQHLQCLLVYKLGLKRHPAVFEFTFLNDTTPHR